MYCQIEQQNMDAAIVEIKAFSDEQARVLTETAARETVSSGQEMGDDSLSGAIGAGAGAAIGSLVGPAGTTVGAVIGREIGKFFVVDIETRPTRFSLDLPSVSMRRQDMSMELPSVAVRNRDIIFHTPSVRMVRVKTGEYPEVTCGGFLGLQCTVTYSPIYIDVPEPFMEEQRIVIGIPEVTMIRQDLSFDAPQIEMVTQEFVFDVPHVTVRTQADVAARIKDTAVSLSDRFKADAANLTKAAKELSKERIIPKLSALFACHRQTLEIQLRTVPQQFDPGIEMMNATLQNMASRAVPSDDDDYINAAKNRDKLLQDRINVVRQIEAQIAELVAKEQTAITQILGS